jgi:hypothetical protein
MFYHGLDAVTIFQVLLKTENRKQVRGSLPGLLYAQDGYIRLRPCTPN